VFVLLLEFFFGPRRARGARQAPFFALFQAFRCRFGGARGGSAHPFFHGPFMFFVQARGRFTLAPPFFFDRV
jgi:hypothetical protein